MGTWKAEPGKACTKHLYIQPDGRIKGVVVQTAAGYTPKVGGNILPGRWPGMVGAAKKALVTHKETTMGTKRKTVTQNELEAREELAVAEAEQELAAANLKLAKAKAKFTPTPAPTQKPAPQRTAANVQAQTTYTSNWYKNQHVSNRGYVQYQSDTKYRAIVDGQLVAYGNGGNPTKARNAAKKLVTVALKAKGISWEPRTFNN